MCFTRYLFLLEVIKHCFFFFIIIEPPCQPKWSKDMIATITLHKVSILAFFIIQAREKRG